MTSPTGACLEELGRCSPPTSAAGSTTPGPPHDALAAPSSHDVDPVTGEPVRRQLYLYDPTAFGGDGAVAVAAGDLDTADNVAVTVPGLGTDGESAPYLADAGAHALRVDPVRRRHAQTNATLFWIGYDAPDNLPWDGDGGTRAGVLDEGHGHARAGSGWPTPSTGCGPPATATPPT